MGVVDRWAGRSRGRHRRPEYGVWAAGKGILGVAGLGVWDSEICFAVCRDGSHVPPLRPSGAPPLKREAREP
ncbi:hypothetical protein BOO71_0010885 [Deinococcus marmoris]|uniref:Uncharacterized protein n=1 Tax=Deinococcus marmoris TaxID=249408 RepID=A0A1U7NV13_9DEIO|nr:hypothetical protein BOO71_0010885 [Deinococcus marmoris]